MFDIADKADTGDARRHYSHVELLLEVHRSAGVEKNVN